MNEVIDEEIDLWDYIAVIAKRFWTIAIITITTVIVAAFVSLRLPKIYASTARIVPPQQSRSINIPPGLERMAGNLIDLKSTADLWVGILKSRTVADAIIGKLNLMKHYKAETMDGARNTLKGRVTAEKSRQGGLISVTVEDEVPEMASDMANAFVEELDRVNRNMVTTAGGRMRTFVGKRLEEAREELSKTEEALKDFQEKNKTVKLDDQSKAIIAAIGTVKGQLMAKQVEFKTMLSYFTPNHPQVKILKANVEELKGRLRELEEGSNNLSRKDFFIPTSRIPNLSLQYVRLIRDAKIHETLYELLTQQYEMARIEEAKDTPTVQVLDRAPIPQQRAKPKRRLIVMIAGVVGLMVGAGCAFLAEYMDTTLKTPKELQEQLGVPYLGLLNTVSKAVLGKGDLIVAHSPELRVVENLRMVRTNIVFSCGENERKMLVVTSALPLEGKSFVCMNLALALAHIQVKKRVLLVDADMRKPKVHKVFGFAPSPGLSEMLVGASSIQQAVRKTDFENLDVITSGTVFPNPADFLGSEHARKGLEELEGKYEWILFDSPPLVSATDAAELAAIAGGVLLVVRSGETGRDLVQRSIQQLQDLNVRVVGAVLNFVDYKKEKHYYKNYYGSRVSANLS